MFEILITDWRTEEIEKGIILNCFGHGTHRSSRFMLLILLNSFYCNILALLPIDHAALHERFLILVINIGINIGNQDQVIKALLCIYISQVLQN